MTSQRVLTFLLIAFTSVVFAAKTGQSSWKQARIDRVRKDILSFKNVLPSLENTKKEDLDEAIKLMQLSNEIITGSDLGLENNHISVIQKPFIPLFHFDDHLTVTVKVDEHPFSANYFYKCKALVCAIMGAKGRIVTMVAFTDNEPSKKRIATTQALMDIILNPSGWHNDQNSMKTPSGETARDFAAMHDECPKMPSAPFQRDLSCLAIRDELVWLGRKINFIDRMNVDFRSIDSICGLALSGMQDTFDILMQVVSTVFKSLCRDQFSSIIVKDSLTYPLKMDDDSLVCILVDKADGEYTLAFFYVNNVLHCALIDSFGRPWGGGILTNQSKLPSINPEMTIELCSNILNQTRAFWSVVEYLTNVYGNNLGEQVTVAIAYAKMGLQFCCMDVRVEGETVIVENKGCSISIQRQEKVLHVTDNKTGVQSTFG